MNTITKVLTGLTASTLLAAGLGAGTTPIAQAASPDQRPMNVKRFLHAKDVTKVFPKYTSVKTRHLDAPKRHLSACTGKDDLSDVVAVRKTRYGVLRQDRDDHVLFKVTQQAARDTVTDGDAVDTFDKLTDTIGACHGQMFDNGLISMPVVTLHTSAHVHAAYVPLRTDDFVMLGAVVIVTNQDHVNVLRISTQHAIQDKQMNELTKLAAKRLR